MGAPAGDPPTGRLLAHRSPPLHPLEVLGAPHRRYQLALGLQLLSTAGTLAAGTGLALPAAGSTTVAAGVLVAGTGWAGARALRRRAWSSLPAPRRRAPMPLTDDRRYASAAALLLTLWAVAVSTFGPVGGFLAAVIGLDAVLAALSSWRWLAGHASDPARRAPALLTTAALCWAAAATTGGLGVRGVLAVTTGVGLLAAAGHAVLAVLRRTMRP